MNDAAPPVAGQRVQWLPVDKLRFDAENPRLEDEDRGVASQQELAALLDELYDASEIAASIAAFGYFPSEVLIGIPGPGDSVVIVEGNRRLAAVCGLTQPEMRAAFSSPREWDRLADLGAAKSHLPDTVPVLIEPNRAAVIPTIGYRHISGIEPWEPYQQARYIAERIDNDGLTPKEVAELTGITETQVRSKYRNYGISKAAEKSGADPALIQESFGVWDAALGRVALRQFIGAPDPAQVHPGEAAIPPDKEPSLREFVGWLFGPTKRIRESRDLGVLADVVANSAGLQALRSGQTLQEAQQATKQPKLARDRLVQHLSAAVTALRGAGALVSNDGESAAPGLLSDSQVAQLVAEIEKALEPFLLREP